MIFITQDDSTKKSAFQCNLNFINFLNKFNQKYIFIKDRKKAIEKILSFAKENDGVFILGRGDQKFMKVHKEVIPFNDIEITRDLIRKIYQKRINL